MNNVALSLLLLLNVTGVAFSKSGEEECSTVVVSGTVTPDGGPLLWKNRDTDQLSNKVVFVDDKPYSYLALVNADDSTGVMVWAGLNSAGLAIANSVAYNLPRKTDEYADLEGVIMASALRKCATVDEFELFLKSRLGPDLGSQANFCLIDAHGSSAIFEAHNHAYARINAAECPEKYIVNTNFSRSGTEDQGSGYLRFDRESELFKAVSSDRITHEYILQTVARDLGHPLVVSPPREEWNRLPSGTPRWIHSNHTIDRGSTACAVVFQGVKSGANPDKAIMWVILGEPVCSIAIPLWVAAGAPPRELKDGNDAQIFVESRRLKELLRPLKSRERKEYLDLTRLDNNAGTGWLPSLLDSERGIFAETAELQKENPSVRQRTDYEAVVAKRVLSILQKIR